MSIYVPQSPEQFAEALELSSATEMIIGKHSIAPRQAPLFNALTSMHIMTMPETLVPIEEFYDALVGVRNCVDTLFSRGKAYGYDFVTKDGKRFLPGRLLFSATLPADFYYEEGKVRIVQGILAGGTVSSAHIGTARKSIVQVLVNDYDNDTAADFINDATNVSDTFIDNIGITVGTKDLAPITHEEMSMKKTKELAKRLGIQDADTKDKEQLKEEIEAKGEAVPEAKSLKEELDAIWESVTEEFEEISQREKDPEAEAERIGKVNNLFNRYNARTGKLADEYMMPESSLRIMLTAGAKGSLTNAQRIFATTGVQTYRGSVPESNLGPGRTNVYTREGSLDPTSLGLCRNSFVEGFTPKEWLFHAISGREGLSDVATQTAEAGESFKSLSKSLENLKITQFGDVRDNANNVNSFAYPFMPQYHEFVKVNEENAISIVDMKRMVGRINTKLGYDKKGEKLPPVDYNYRALQLPKFDLMKMIDTVNETVTLKVKDKDGKMVSVEADYYEPIADVRKRVAEKKGQDPDAVELIFRGVALEDDKFMADYVGVKMPEQKLTIAMNRGAVALNKFAGSTDRAFHLTAE